MSLVEPGKGRAARAQDAFRRGDFPEARRLLTEEVRAGAANADVWRGLALVARRLGDPKGEAEALDTLLRFEPRDVRALIARADLHEADGVPRTAAAFYATAVRLAEPVEERLPPDLRSEVSRAREAVARHALGYETWLRERLAAEGEEAGPRFSRSLELLSGRRKRYVQEPRVYCFPDLPQIEFYDRADFVWAPEVEARTDAIRSELLTVLEQEGAFQPYVERDVHRPVENRYGLIGDPSWSAFFIVKHGRPTEAGAALCPQTLETVLRTPLAAVPDRSPSVLFSLLRPGARIPPHTGFVNTRLICHLPLIVPPGCGLRVGGETRSWREGELLVFDDTIEHEAWNDSDETRVILLFDVWRPELTEDERRAVASLFAAVDAYGGPQAAPWTDG